MRLFFVLLAAIITASACVAQSNKPINREETPADGKPYNVIPEDGVKRAIVRHYNWNRRTASGENNLTFLVTSRTLINGWKRRDCIVNVWFRPDDDKSIMATAFVPVSDLDKVSNELNDALRVLKNWLQAGVPQVDKRIDYSLSSAVRVTIEKSSGDPINFPVRIQVTEGNVSAKYYFKNIPEFDKFVKRFDEFTNWLEAK